MNLMCIIIHKACSKRKNDFMKIHFSVHFSHFTIKQPHIFNGKNSRISTASVRLSIKQGLFQKYYTKISKNTAERTPANFSTFSKITAFCKFLFIYSNKATPPLVRGVLNITFYKYDYSKVEGSTYSSPWASATALKVTWPL